VPFKTLHASTITYPYLDVAIALAHSFCIAFFLASTALSLLLPSLVDSMHDVYDDLESAAARIFLPSRKGDFVELSEDATSSKDAGGNIPDCFGLADVASRVQFQSRQLPEWALEDDNGGLEALAGDLVRRNLVRRRVDDVANGKPCVVHAQRRTLRVLMYKLTEYRCRGMIQPEMEI
jgi:hypothetical protein